MNFFLSYFLNLTILSEAELRSTLSKDLVTKFGTFGKCYISAMTRHTSRPRS